jgi:hypothetical protein
VPFVVGAGVPRRPLPGVAALGALVGWVEVMRSGSLTTLAARTPSSGFRSLAAGALVGILASAAKPYDVPDRRAYCVLLYTGASGLQDEVHRYINNVGNTTYLDSLTGGNCSTMSVEPRTKRTRKGTKPYSPGQVLGVAADFGLRKTQLPAAVFFYDWANKGPDDVTRVPLEPVFESAPPGDRQQRMTSVFGKLFAAVGEVAKYDDVAERKREFEKLVEHVRREYVVRRRSRLERAGPVLQLVETTAAVLAIILPGTGLDRWFKHSPTSGGTPYYQVAQPPPDQGQPPSTWQQQPPPQPPPPQGHFPAGGGPIRE